ncbi:hypothetical protein ACQY1Q_08505 [Tenacibaculum sp. TC6]
MKFERRFGRKKKTNPKRGLFLVFLLIIILILWFNAEKFIERIL